MATVLDVLTRLDARIGKARPITENEFRSFVSSERGAKIATILTRTIPSMRKTNNPYFGDCFKLSKVNVIINPSDRGYEKSVNNQRSRENLNPTFEAGPRLWGTKLTGIPFVSHVNENGEHLNYFWVKIQKTLWEKYIDSRGNFLDAEEILPYIIPSNGTERQGVAKPVQVRNYKIENVMGIFVDGESFRIDHP